MMTVAHIAGIFTGTTIGLLVAAVLAAAKRGDESSQK